VCFGCCANFETAAERFQLLGDFLNFSLAILLYVIRWPIITDSVDTC